MIRKLLPIILGIVALVPNKSFGQSEKKEKTDVSVSLESFDNVLGKGDQKDQVKYPRVYGGITFTRIDWGFSRLVDNGSFTLSENNSDFSYKKASNFGFDVAQFGLRFNDNFKAYVSAGFDWDYYRLKRDVQLVEGSSPIAIDDLPDAVYNKNIFTTTYLRLPLTFEWRTNKLRSGERIKFAVGGMGGVLLKGTQRLKSNQFGKQKFKDNYSLQTFRYGAFARIGYDSFGLFFKYYASDLFENSPEHEGLKNMSFGLTLGF